MALITVLLFLIDRRMDRWMDGYMNENLFVLIERGCLHTFRSCIYWMIEK